jgi:hypothetical protein
MTIFRTCAIGVLLVLLAGPALAQPPVAVPVAPTSDVYGNTIAFTWNSSTGATWYQFWLGKADTTFILEQWYTAEAVGCTGGGGCTMTLSAPIKAGGYVWYVRAYNGAYAAWSAPYNFTVKDLLEAWSGKLPNSRRFSLVLNNEAVLDNETALVWQRTPGSGTMTWHDASIACVNQTNGGRRGWRLATIQELASLTETTGSAPRLPAGHPFVLPADPLLFWSATDQYGYPGQYFVMDLATGISDLDAVADMRKMWCVRGPTS